MQYQGEEDQKRKTNKKNIHSTIANQSDTGGETKKKKKKKKEKEANISVIEVKQHCLKEAAI